MNATLSSRAAANLRGQLARRNLTQEEFADKAGISRGTLANILSGRTVLDLDRLEKFAELLEVDAVKLLTD